MNGLPESFTDRLAMTLCHFLWQGTLVALAVALTAPLAGPQPRRRYNLFFFAMVFMAACPLLTFWWLGIAEPSSSQTSGLEVIVSSGPEISARQSEEIRNVNSSIAVESAAHAPFNRSWLRSSERWIVGFWFVGVSILAARLIGGWGWLRWLGRRHEPAPSWLLEQAQRLSQRLRISMPAVRISRRLGEAIATGLVRPTIVLPFVWLTDLPADMLEAVLAHELAHLVRRDLWANLFQRITETLLFYHPAVWWLSRQVRLEREFCCDQLAVALTNKRLRYAETLERVGRLSAYSAAETAVAMTGAGNLFRRVQHVLHPQAAKAPASWSLAGVLMMATAVAIWSACFLEPPQFPYAAAVESRDGDVLVTVIDKENHPLPNLEVQVYKERQKTGKPLRTDSKGRLQIQSAWLDNHEQYALIASSNDHLGWLEFSRRRSVEKPSDLRMVMLPLDHLVRGRLTDASGEPIARVRVEITALAGDKTNQTIFLGETQGLIPGAISDADGRFVLKTPSGTLGRIQTRHRDWQTMNSAWRKGQTDVGTMKLERGTRIVGTVLDATWGKPVAGAVVDAQIQNQALNKIPDSSWSASAGSAITDMTGRFEIVGLVPASYNVSLRTPGENPHLVAQSVEGVSVSLGGQEPRDILLRVLKGRKISGKVVEAKTGKPVADAFVGCHNAARPASSAAIMAAYTDVQGKFEFYVPPGTALIYIDEGAQTASKNQDNRRTIEVGADRDPEPIVLKASRPQLREVVKSLLTPDEQDLFEMGLAPPDVSEKFWRNIQNQIEHDLRDDVQDAKPRVERLFEKKSPYPIDTQFRQTMPEIWDYGPLDQIIISDSSPLPLRKAKAIGSLDARKPAR